MKMKLFAIIALIICAVFVLSGCIPDKYDSKKRAEIEAKGKPILEEYVKSLPAAGEIIDCKMITGAEVGGNPYGGFFLTNVVSCRFKVGEKRKTAMVNLETGEIWTDYYMYDVNEAVKKQLEPYVRKAGYSCDFTVNGARIYGNIISHDMETTHNSGKNVDTVVTFQDMTRSDIVEPDKDKWAEKVLTEAELTGFSISFKSVGGNLPDVSFLYDYLKDSGNYLKGDYWDQGLSNYRLSYNVENDPSVIYWTVNLEMDKSPDKMTFNVIRGNREKIDDMTFQYVGAALSGDYKEDWGSPLYEFECPVKVGEGIMNYYGTEAGNVSVFFDEEPKYKEFKRITYTNGKPDEPENLSVKRLDDGRYSLYDGKKINEDGYVFSYEQDIKFE